MPANNPLVHQATWTVIGKVPDRDLDRSFKNKYYTINNNGKNVIHEQVI